jgi:hypothetical protein
LLEDDAVPLLVVDIQDEWTSAEGRRRGHARSG